jgi:hypothetical protein
MAKYVRNTGKHWGQPQVSQLRQMAIQNTPTRVIGLKLGRPVAGVYAKAAEKNIAETDESVPVQQEPTDKRMNRGKSLNATKRIYSAHRNGSRFKEHQTREACPH